MKYLAATAVVLISLSIAPAKTVADAGHSDPVCPNATHAIQTYLELAKIDTTRVADAVAAANAASDAFDRCADKYRSSGDAERSHYAAVGSAQYRFTAGRLLHLDGYFDQARDALKGAIAEVADTIAWGTPEAPSAYHDTAISVRDEAQGDLDQIADASPSPSPTPMPTASASPAPTETATPDATPSASASPR